MSKTVAYALADHLYRLGFETTLIRRADDHRWVLAAVNPIQ